VASDGYTDVSSRYLINFVINSATGGFLDCTTEMGLEDKNAEAIAKLFDPLFQKYGRDITAVVTDSASVMKAAGKLLEAKYPWITWLPCVTYQADLIMKKIAKLPYFKDTVSQVCQPTHVSGMIRGEDYQVHDNCFSNAVLQWARCICCCCEYVCSSVTASDLTVPLNLQIRGVCVWVTRH
jgi:hypothetical protein